MKFLRSSLIVFILTLFPTMVAAQTSVLIADADFNNNGNLTSALLTEFDIVDDFDLVNGTPVLGDLTPYDVVVVYTDLIPLDPEAAGDVFADYVDAGGCVVISTYAFSSPWAVTGRMQTPGYSPLVNIGVNGYVSGSLNALVADDPIFDGIDLGALSYFANSNFSHPDLDAGATLIADDGNGINMIARNGAGNIVGLNLFPGNIFNNNDELYSLFANAAANCYATIEVAIDIKFCSDPNAFNCKKSGVLPVTVFGTPDFSVEDIDISTLQLCTEDLSDCTGAPRDYSVADRGNPLSDLGAAMCAINPDTGEEFLTKDGYLDLDAAFEASEIQAMLGDFCGADKGAISGTLVLIGSTWDGTPITSVPVGNLGIDQLLKQNK